MVMECPIDVLVEWFAESDRINQALDKAQRDALEAARGL
jgi:hypothetical protein